MPLDPDLAARDMPENASGYAVGFHSMTRLYRQNRDITAVFAFADILAIGAAKAALSLGLGIPDDISILGFDGIEMTEYYQPPLDTVHQPAAEMALAGVEILFDMIRNNPSRHLVFKPALLKRGSCCKI
jgi:LacI family transcriptional regulator